jgi:hypothetical protein
VPRAWPVPIQCVPGLISCRAFFPCLGTARKSLARWPGLVVGVPGVVWVGMELGSIRIRLGYHAPVLLLFVFTSRIWFSFLSGFGSARVGGDEKGAVGSANGRLGLRVSGWEERCRVVCLFGVGLNLGRPRKWCVEYSVNRVRLFVLFVPAYFSVVRAMRYVYCFIKRPALSALGSSAEDDFAIKIYAIFAFLLLPIFLKEKLFLDNS